MFWYAIGPHSRFSPETRERNFVRVLLSVFSGFLEKILKLVPGATERAIGPKQKQCRGGESLVIVREYHGNPPAGL